MMRYPATLLALLSLLLCMTTAVFAQQAAEEPIINKLMIEFKGPRNVSDQAVLAHVRVREGEPYNLPLVDQSIRSLYQTNLYEFIEVQREPAPGDKINLRFVIIPKFKIQSILFSGNEEYSDARLRDKIESSPADPVDELRIKRDADAIQEYYQKKGYANAEVDYQIERNEERGDAVVTYLISEGNKRRIADIEFKGAEQIDEDDLEDVMQTGEYIPVLSILTGSGKFEEDKFFEDLEALRQYYKNQGYLDVEIRESDVQFLYPSEKKLKIVIQIEEGRQYQVGEITFDGNRLYSNEQVQEVITLEPGDTFSPSRVDENAENIRDLYGRDGYLDTGVRAERIPNIDTGNIDLNYSIREGDKYFVESVNISGNTKTKSVVITRELALAPGDVFDTVRMKNSEARLENTRFFEHRGGVTVSPEETNIPGRRNLRIQVKEADTGQISFGAGFSSLERGVVFGELQQSNFDLFNYKNRFQGDGQKFRIRMELGTRSNEMLLSFEEPWVFERRLAFGFDLFRTETDYVSTLYNELRTGTEIYFRKRLFELVDARLFYRVESVDVSDIDAIAPIALKNEAGERSVSKPGIGFSRDTRDNLLVTTEGSRVEYLTAVAGGPFMGQTDYWENEIRGGKWITLHPYRTQVLQIVGRAGAIMPYGDSPDTPFFDRYFLGGPYSLRGFDYRDVGPKDVNGQEVGGNSFAYGSLEYSIEVAEPVRFAVFYDWGFVNSDEFDYDPSDYNDNWGVGMRVLMMGSPLRLDFGFPITADDFNDDGAQFHFSFGTTF